MGPDLINHKIPKWYQRKNEKWKNGVSRKNEKWGQDPLNNFTLRTTGSALGEDYLAGVLP